MKWVHIVIVRPLTLLLSSLIPRKSACTRVAIMGFWVAECAGNKEFKGDGGDKMLEKDMSELVFRVG